MSTIITDVRHFFSTVFLTSMKKVGLGIVTADAVVKPL